MRRCANGESLFEVVLAMGIVATLTLTFAQTQITQARMQRTLQERVAAMALLDAMAETRRMHIVATVATVAANTAGTATDWQARAASTLPDARLSVRRVSPMADRLHISWRSGVPSSVRGEGVGRCFDADLHRLCESIDVPLLANG